MFVLSGLEELGTVMVVGERTAAIAAAAHAGFSVAVTTDLALGFPVAALTGNKARYEDPRSGDTPGFLRRAYLAGALAGHTLMAIQGAIAAESAGTVAGGALTASIAGVSAPVTVPVAIGVGIGAAYEAGVAAVASANAAKVSAELARYRDQMNSGGGSSGNYKTVKEVDGNAFAQEAGFENAHELKDFALEGQGGNTSLWNIEVDRAARQWRLRGPNNATTGSYSY